VASCQGPVGGKCGRNVRTTATAFSPATSKPDFDRKEALYPRFPCFGLEEAADSPAGSLLIRSARSSYLLYMEVSGGAARKLLR
jgi:hypothetical protein